MSNQNILSDAELIVKGYNSIIADAQDEFEEVKAEVLLQLEDLDEGFETYREFELRLEAYENGAFDPDIEKIWGIGGRKAGTWNPRSEKAKENRARGRLKSRGTVGVEDANRIKDADDAAEWRAQGRAGVHPSQFKGSQPGGGLKGAGRGYKGGDLSDRDTFAGAVARKIVGGKRGAAQKKEATKQAVKDKASQSRQAVADTSSAVAGKLGEGKDKTVAVSRGTGRATGFLGGKLGGKISRGASRFKEGVKGVARETAAAYREGASGNGQSQQPSGRTSGTPSGQEVGVRGIQVRSTPKPVGVNKSFSNRLRKSMGYRGRRI